MCVENRVDWFQLVLGRELREEEKNWGNKRRRERLEKKKDWLSKEQSEKNRC